MFIQNIHFFLAYEDEQRGDKKGGKLRKTIKLGNQKSRASCISKSYFITSPNPFQNQNFGRHEGAWGTGNVSQTHFFRC